jgi:hypothetical protein
MRSPASLASARKENLQAQTGSWSWKRMEKRKETEMEMMIERTMIMSEREMRRIAIPKRLWSL